MQLFFLQSMPQGDMGSLASQFSSIYDTVKIIVFIMSGCFGLAAGIKIYQQWQIGHKFHITMQIAGWGAASIFLLLAAFIIEKLLL
ncbi:MAG: DUF4134 family protein [Bacteroidetes bacterium]|nr:DUF4134 family protein [Bacteroidota bacterium]